MNKNEKLDHMLALTEEVNILTQRIQPHDTGYIHTTISTLRDRIEDVLFNKSPNATDRLLEIASEHIEEGS